MSHIDKCSKVLKIVTFLRKTEPLKFWKHNFQYNFNENFL